MALEFEIASVNYSRNQPQKGMFLKPNVETHSHLQSLCLRKSKQNSTLFALALGHLKDRQRAILSLVFDDQCKSPQEEGRILDGSQLLLLDHLQN